MISEELRYKKAKAYESKRFILTGIGMFLLVLASLFPMNVIYKAADKDQFDMTAAWTAWGSVVSSLVLIIGNYVIKESNKPSLIGFGGMGINIPKPKYKELKNHEDESDPEDMPF